MRRQSTSQLQLDSARRHSHKTHFFANCQAETTAASSDKCLRLVLPLVAIVVLVWIVGGSALRAQSEWGRFLVLISEKQTDISPRGLNLSNCAIILPDGRFHFEHRVQQLPSSGATLTVFESSLDSAQSQEIQAILGKEEIRQLPAYVQPKLPIGAPFSYGFNARIARPKGVQNVGYWTWRGGPPEAPPNTETETVKKAWQQSEDALRPLADWLHGIEDSRMIPSDTQSTLCTTDAGERTQ
jgi:hypothetical protein